MNPKKIQLAPPPLLKSNPIQKQEMMLQASACSPSDVQILFQTIPSISSASSQGYKNKILIKMLSLLTTSKISK